VPRQQQVTRLRAVFKGGRDLGKLYGTNARIMGRRFMQCMALEMRGIGHEHLDVGIFVPL
jgi:hypothetical protein